MGNDFRAIIQLLYDTAKGDKQMQSYIKKVEKKYKINVDTNIVYKDAEKQLKKLYDLKKQYSKIDSPTKDEVYYYEQAIKKAQELYKIAHAKTSEPEVYNFQKRNELELKSIQYERQLSDIVNKQTQNVLGKRISAENQLQAELKQTAKDQQSALDLKSAKIQLDNRISAYLRENSKLSDEFKSKLVGIQKQLSSTDKVGLHNLSNQFKEVSTEARATGVAGKGMLDEFKTNIKGFLTFFVGAGGVVSAIQSVGKVVSTVSELDKSIVDLQMATGNSLQQTKELLNTYIDLGQQMGATGVEVADAASSWLKQGKSISDTNTLIKDSLILSKIGTIESADATKYLTTITKSYGITAQDTLSVVDKLSKVDLTSATDVGGLASALNEVSSNAQSLGVNLDELLGYVAAIGETSGEQMSAVGNSLNTMFSRMGNIKLKRLVNPETNEDLSNTETSLRRVGIVLREDSGTFRNFSDVLKEVASKWSGYNDVTKQSIATSIAGVDHINDFKILMQQFGKATEYTNASMNSSGTAMQKFESYTSSVESKTKKLQATFQEFASNTLNSSFIKGFLDASSTFIEFADKSNLVELGLIALSAVALYKGIPAIADLTISIKGNIIALGELIAEEIAASGSTGILSKSMTALSVAMDSNPIGVLILGLTALYGAVKGINAIYDASTTTMSEHIDNIKKSKEAYEDSKNTLSSLNSELVTTQDRITELNKLPSLTFTQEAELENLKKQNNELQRSIELEKTKQQLASKSTVNEINNTYDSYKKNYGDMSSFKTNKQSTQSYVNQANSDINNASKYYNGDFLDKYIADKQKQVDNWNGEIDGLKTQYLDYATQLEDWIKSFETLGVDNLSKSQKNTYNSMKSDLDNIYKTVLSSSEYKKTVLEPQFTKIFDSDSFKDAKKQLTDLSKAGKLTTDVLTSNKEYNRLLTDTGLSASDAVKRINALSSATDDQSNSTDQATASLKEMTDAYTKLTDADNALTDLKKEIKDFKAISNESLASLLEKFPELSDVISDYKVGLASTSDVYNALSNVYQTDLDNWTKLNIAKYQNSEEFYNKIGGNNANLINTMKNEYGIDLSNDKSYYTAKMDILNTFFKDAGANWQTYYDIASGKLQNMSLLKSGEQYIVAKAAYESEKALGTFNKGLNFKGIDASFKASNADFSTSKSKDKSSTKTELPKAYQSAKAELEHRHQMGLADAQYYKELKGLEDKYLKGHKAYQSEIWSIDEAIYDYKKSLIEKEKSLMKDTVDKQRDAVLKDIEDSYNRQTEALEKQRDTFKDIIDAQKELINQQEKERTYQEDVSDKTNDINNIKARMSEIQKAASQGDRTAINELDQLNDELAKKNKDLADTQHAHDIELQNQALDNALANNDTIISKQLADAQTAYDDKVNKINLLYDTELSLIDRSTEYTRNSFGKAILDITNQLASLGANVSAVDTNAILNAQSPIAKGSTGGTSTTTSGTTTSNNNTTKTDPTKDAITNLLKHGTSTSGTSDLNKYVHKKYGTYLTYGEIYNLAKLLKVSGIDDVNDVKKGSNITKVYNALKKAKFSEGGLASVPQAMGEDAWALVKNQELILNQNGSKVFRGDLVPLMKDFVQKFNVALPDMSNVVTNNNSSPTIQVILPPNTTIDNSAINNYRKFIPEITKAVSDEILNAGRQYK